MKVVLGQLCPVLNAPSANCEKLADVLYRYRDADLAVFPELFLSGYALTSHRTVANQCFEKLHEIAMIAAEVQTAVIVGLPMLKAGKQRNAAACISETGQIVSTYEKIALFGDERHVFASGEELVVCRLAGIDIAPLICFDIEFPELARAVAKGGVDLFVVIAANMSPYYIEHQLFSRVRALENRRPLVYVNQVGVLGSLTFVGGSRVVADDGAVLLELSRNAEGVSVGEVSIRRRLDWRIDYLSQPIPTVPVWRSSSQPLGQSKEHSSATGPSLP